MHREPRIRLFLTGQAVSFFGDQLYLFAIVWWVLLSTGSITAGTTVVLVAALAAVVAAPAAGGLIDRSDRLRLLVLTNWAYAAVTLTSGLLMVTDRMSWGLLLAFAVVVASLDQLAIPAAATVPPALVPAGSLRSVNGSLETWKAVAGIGAPILAGLVAHTPSAVGWLLVADAATFVLNGGCLARLGRSVDRTAALVAGPTVVSAIRGLSGSIGPVVQLLRERQVLAVVLVVTTLAGLLIAPVGVLVPDAMRGAGATAAGAAMSAFAMGVLVVARGTGWLRRLPDGGLIVAGLATIAVGDVVFGLAPAVGIACVGSFLAGAGTVSVIIAGRTWFQREVPAELQGRMFSMRFAGATLARPVGLAVGGAVAAEFGSARTVLMIGVCTAVLALVAAPSLLRKPDGRAAGGVRGQRTTAVAPD